MSQDALARLIAESRRAVVFTGAGISTESGIPDFRSPGGVWSRMKPIYFEEFVASEDKRREAWTRTFSGAMRLDRRQAQCRPLRRGAPGGAGKVGAVITQNVDNLHQESGVPADQRHRAARQRQLRHLPRLRPAARARGVEAELSRPRRDPRLPRLRRPGQDRDHLLRPGDAAAPRWTAPRRRRWRAICSSCSARRWWSIRRPAFRCWRKRNGAALGHRQSRADRAGRDRRSRHQRRDRPDPVGSGAVRLRLCAVPLPIDRSP